MSANHNSSYPLPQTPGLNGNLWAGIKSFGERGGFTTGLNPTQIGKIWYVKGLGPDGLPIGSDGSNGSSPTTSFATVARALSFAQNYDVIVVDGVIREQIQGALNLYDITIMGAVNTPRQATSGGVATGGGATWLPPASPTALTPLLEIRGAGWTIANIQFSPTTGSACVRLTRSAVVDTIDASHAKFVNCYFSGGGTTPIGIEDNGGCGFVVIQNCRFQNLTSGIKSLNTAAAIPLSWQIISNRFQQNTNDITMSLSYAEIMWNNFMTAGSGATNKVIQTNFITAQGNNNHVSHNQFTNTGAQVANASGYNAGANDMWADNYCSDAVDYGIPA